jgi:glycosyltransferase involved in cell wall biosynthesis
MTGSTQARSQSSGRIGRSLSALSAPTVSIVTPSYNQAGYLERTIQSVLQQDYANLDYAIVDGGSSDGSVEIIKKFENALSWWVSEKDTGQAEAINKGLIRARGEIVAWLNSDDIYLPGAIQKAVDALQANPELGFVFGDAITIDPDGQPINELIFGDWGFQELLRFRIICQPAVFMRREVLEKTGGLDQSLHYMLDHHLWLRMARLAPIRHIPGFLAAARQHPGAKNVNQAAGFGRETLQLFERLKNEPEFAHLLKSQSRRVKGGAYRLNARYLLDAGQAGPALAWYGRAMAVYPSYTLRHWHRILYAGLCLVGMGKIGDRINERNQQRRTAALKEKLATGCCMSFGHPVSEGHAVSTIQGLKKWQ